MEEVIKQLKANKYAMRSFMHKLNRYRKLHAQMLKRKNHLTVDERLEVMEQLYWLLKIERRLIVGSYFYGESVPLKRKEWAK